MEYLFSYNQRIFDFQVISILHQAASLILPDRPFRNQTFEIFQTFSNLTKVSRLMTMQRRNQPNHSHFITLHAIHQSFLFLLINKQPLFIYSPLIFTPVYVLPSLLLIHHHLPLQGSLLKYEHCAQFELAASLAAC